MRISVVQHCINKLKKLTEKLSPQYTRKRFNFFMYSAFIINLALIFMSNLSIAQPSTSGSITLTELLHQGIQRVLVLATQRPTNTEQEILQRAGNPFRLEPDTERVFQEMPLFLRLRFYETLSRFSVQWQLDERSQPNPGASQPLVLGSNVTEAEALEVSSGLLNQFFTGFNETQMIDLAVYLFAESGVFHTEHQYRRLVRNLSKVDIWLGLLFFTTQLALNDGNLFLRFGLTGNPHDPMRTHIYLGLSGFGFEGRGQIRLGGELAFPTINLQSGLQYQFNAQRGAHALSLDALLQLQLLQLGRDLRVISNSQGSWNFFRDHERDPNAFQLPEWRLQESLLMRFHSFMARLALIIDPPANNSWIPTVTGTVSAGYHHSPSGMLISLSADPARGALGITAHGSLDGSESNRQAQRRQFLDSERRRVHRRILETYLQLNNDEKIERTRLTTQFLGPVRRVIIFAEHAARVLRRAEIQLGGLCPYSQRIEQEWQSLPGLLQTDPPSEQNSDWRTACGLYAMPIQNR